ncbi:hypothetical protein [Stackebrandtia soli]|uniref:hypothetical protein n=1 Tax=Stackebrandtia soli TaxID=1892856 RepID=UPI0039EAE918
MPDKSKPVAGLAEYLAVRSRCARVFDLDARFPDQVFRRPAGDSLFCEFDVLLTPELWPALCAMARWHGDDQIDLMVLEPDLDGYLAEGLGYPVRSLSADASEDDYWDAVGFTSTTADDFSWSFTVSAIVVAITGASAKWGCWADRDPELAVFQGFLDAPTRSEWYDRFGPFLDVSGALEVYHPTAIVGRTVPESFVGPMAANYGLSPKWRDQWQGPDYMGSGRQSWRELPWVS